MSRRRVHTVRSAKQTSRSRPKAAVKNVPESTRPLKSEANAPREEVFPKAKFENANDEDLITVGFMSPTLSFEAELLVDEFADIIIEHVPSYHEFMAAIELLVPLDAASGNYDGTGWGFWFVRVGKFVTLH